MLPPHLKFSNGRYLNINLVSVSKASSPTYRKVGLEYHPKINVKYAHAS